MKTNFLKIFIPLSLVCLLVASILLYDFPSYFSGNYQGTFEPHQIPQALQRTNDWLSKQPGDFEVLWLPPPGQPPKWNPVGGPNVYLDSSPKPGIAVDFSSVYLNLIYYALIYNQTTVLGKLIVPLDVRFVVFHDDVEASALNAPGLTNHSILAALFAQSDLTLVLQDDFMYVFKNLEETGVAYAPSNLFEVIGGPSTLLYLSNYPTFNPLVEGVVLYDQLSQKNSQITPTLTPIFVDGRGPVELVLSTLPAPYVIFPADHTSAINSGLAWIAITPTTTRGYDQFQTNVPGEKWGFDYTRGLVSTYAENVNLDIPLSLKLQGPTDVWIRALRGPYEGTIGVTVDGVSSRLDLYDPTFSGYSWQLMNQTNLQGESHKVSLENVKGINVVNAIAIVPHSILDLSLQDFVSSQAYSKSLQVLTPSGVNWSSGALVKDQFGAGGFTWHVVPSASVDLLPPPTNSTIGYGGWDRTTDSITAEMTGKNLRLNYTFVSQSASQVQWTIKYNSLQDWTNLNVINATVYGDGSNNSLQFWVYDNSTNNWYSLGSNVLSWFGWKEVRYDIPASIPRTQVLAARIIVNWNYYKSPSGLGTHTMRVNGWNIYSDVSRLDIAVLHRVGVQSLALLVRAKLPGNDVSCLSLQEIGSKSSLITEPIITSSNWYQFMIPATDLESLVLFTKCIGTIDYVVLGPASNVANLQLFADTPPPAVQVQNEANQRFTISNFSGGLIVLARPIGFWRSGSAVEIPIFGAAAGFLVPAGSQIQILSVYENSAVPYLNYIPLTVFVALIVVWIRPLARKRRVSNS